MTGDSRAAAILGVSVVLLLLGAVALVNSAVSSRGTVEPVGHRSGVASGPSTLADVIPGIPAVVLSERAVGTEVAVAAPVPAPSRVRIPAIDVDTVVVPVGLDSANSVIVPDDISTVGWYRRGAAPGSAEGSSVLVAHRDGRKQGHGAFYYLGSLDVGDRVIVTTTAGGKVPYRVVSRETLEKSAFASAAPNLFAVDGQPRLTLISCGGAYDASAGGYQSNIVITAVPQTAA